MCKINHEVRKMNVRMKSYFFLGCARIEVTSNLGSQECRTGIYRIHNQISNDKATFKHESEEQFLYHMDKGKGFWMVINF